MGAATGIFIASIAGIVGSVIPWVTVEPPPTVPEDQAARAEPFTGLEAGDGWWVLAAGLVMLACAVLFVLTAQRGFAWLSFTAAMVAGAIAIADYRSVNKPLNQQVESELVRRTDVIGDIDPGLGLALVAACGIVGIIASVAGLAASQSRSTT
jgi:hypothetical protein